MTNGVWFDKKGRYIINQLLTDGGISIAALSREVGLTENAVRYRIECLIKEGVLTKPRYTINRKRFDAEETVFLKAVLLPNAYLQMLEHKKSVLAVYKGVTHRECLIVVAYSRIEELRQIIDDFSGIIDNHQTSVLFRGTTVAEYYEGINVVHKYREARGYGVTDD